MTRYAILSCLGLGDGLISLVLAHNLILNGHTATTYHPFLKVLQPLFPHLPIAPFPSLEEVAAYDHIFLFYEKLPPMLKILEFLQTNYPAKLTVLNPIATFRNDYPYWKNGRFDGRRPFAENIESFVRTVLKMERSTTSNGIVMREGLVAGRYDRRIIIHPTSSKPSKNWLQARFLKLSRALEKQGWEPHFVLREQERQGWPSKGLALAPTDLVCLAEWIYESRAMIGNDSGIGHLASCLGLPTVTLCSNHKTILFWKPAWSPSIAITPAAWIPNLKGCRLRDRLWPYWIGVGHVKREFIHLLDGQNVRQESDGG